LVCKKSDLHIIQQKLPSVKSGGSNFMIHQRKRRL